MRSKKLNVEFSASVNYVDSTTGADDMDNPAYLQKRQEMLDAVYAEIKNSHSDRKRQYEEKIHTSTAILTAWAFIFAGIIGLYQIDVLKANNIQQLFLLVIIMIISISLCIKYSLMPQEQDESPSSSALFEKYQNAIEQKDAIKNGTKYIALREQIIQIMIDGEKKNSERLAKTAKMLGYAACLILIELLFVLIFIVCPTLHLEIQ